jgi:folate-binding protein YgfZ
MIVSDCIEKSLNSLSQSSNIEDPDVIFATNLNRGIIKISGNDASSFLQALITNDIYGSATIYAMMLSPQGRYLFDFFITNTGNLYWLETDLSSLSDLIAKLKLYRLRSNVVIEDVSDAYSIVYSHELLPRDKVCEYQDPRFEGMGMRTIVSGGSELATTDLYLRDKYAYAIPDGEFDLIRDKSMPQEYGMDMLKCIDYTKGCYVGQEMISRTKYQGVIRKQIFKIVAESDLSGFEQGSQVTASGTKIGVLCSSYLNEGIGLIRLEDYNTNLGAQFYINGLEVRLEIPAWRADKTEKHG